MNKFMIMALAVASLTITVNAHANNCTKQEMMKMIDRGFSKSEIDKICKKELSCCCKREIYKWAKPKDAGMFDYHDWVYDTTEYKWVSTNDCSGTYEKKNAGGLFGGKKIVKRCTSQSSCGR